MAEILRLERAKALGAFYTDSQVADFLVWWAVRSRTDTILDPSFGAGVFLRSACKKLKTMGGNPAGQVFGVEVDQKMHTQISRELSHEFSVGKENLLLSDFFDMAHIAGRKVDAVVGNPPFIRYQRFGGEVRKQALERAAEHGVRLNRLCSSWAPFLVHCIAMLKDHGRLAMVVPVEITHAAYAKPILNHLSGNFGRVTLLTFRKKLFRALSEDTALLLAEDKGASCARFLYRDLPNSGVLADFINKDRLPLSGTRRIDGQGLYEGRERLAEYFIPRKARELYQQLKRLPSIKRLGEVADVGIGYVTGANSFFHLSEKEVRFYEISATFLKPVVRRGRALCGLRFTKDDWSNALRIGEAGYLLHIRPDAKLPKGVRRYLRKGEDSGVPNAFKCRTRYPWYSVPHVHKPDAFLTYMSGAVPRLVSNEAGVFAPNTLHILRLYDGPSLTSAALSALWQTSLTRLSGEIEGHALGGGMLKLEPTEAENVLLACVPADNGFPDEAIEELDALARSGDDAAAQSLADDIFLKRGIGLTSKECTLLREAARTLQHRRYSRSANA